MATWGMNLSNIPGLPKPPTSPVTNPQVQTQVGTIPGKQFTPGASMNQQIGLGRGIDATLNYDAQGRPIRNKYQSISGNNGQVLNQYSMSNNIGPDIQMGQEGFNSIRSQALAQGPSAWANLANQQQGMEQNNLLQNAQKTAMQGQNSAYNQMRMRGGLSSGQRERLALQGSRNMANNSQNIYNQGAQARLGIGLQDQQRKDQFLSQLPGLEKQQADFLQSQRLYKDQAKQFDIINALKDVGGYNGYNSGAFDKAMQEWSSGKVADAQTRAANSSGGGGLLSGFLGGFGL